MIKLSAIAFSLLSLSLVTMWAPLAVAGDTVNLCPEPSLVRKVAKAYKKKPGTPTPIVARSLKVSELQLSNALRGELASGIVASDSRVRQVWTSIDGWGARTKVNIVMTTGGEQAFDFPSLVPITQPDAGDGFIDIYADDGKGVHGHLFTESVGAIYATDLPGENGDRTRAISFYDKGEELILSVYASINGNEFDQAAVEGFARSRKLIESIGQPACK